VLILLAKFGDWVLRKLIWLVLFTALAVAAFACYLYLQQNLYSENWRQGRLAEIAARQEDLRELVQQASAQWEELNQKASKLTSQIERAQQEIVRRKEQLDALARMWNQVERLWSQEANERYRREELALEQAERQQIRQQNLLMFRREELHHAQLQLEDYEREVQDLSEERSRLEAARSEVLYYLQLSWQRVLPVVLVSAVVIWISPLLWSLVRYYLFAPLLLIGKPVRLRTEKVPLPVMTPRNVSQEIWLQPDEHAMVKPEYLQASDQSLKRRTKWLLDWHIPFTSMACRLAMLVELRNSANAPAMLTVSSQDEAEIEMVVVNLEPEGRLVFRPRYLAAIAKPHGHPIRIKRHWRLFHLHSWITLQFRYFEIAGPCRLVLWGARGVRMEILAASPSSPVAARRTNQHATIGFTPDLVCHSARAETFWTYARGQNPLFDDLFSGEGAFFCQEISIGANKGVLRRWSESFWDALLKVFGW
jgi:hypothetical protein